MDAADYTHNQKKNALNFYLNRYKAGENLDRITFHTDQVPYNQIASAFSENKWFRTSFSCLHHKDVVLVPKVRCRHFSPPKLI